MSVTSPPPRVLVTGAEGQLGHDLVRVLGDRVVAVCGRAQLDITDRAEVVAAVTALAPDVVVNAAAFNAVDACETEADTVFSVNAIGVRHLVDAAARTGARVVHVSSDFVFDGATDRPYTEWDQPRPLSVYGRSKLAGELELGPDDLCVRTAWLAGANGANIVRTVLRLAAGGEQLHFVDDQIGSPSFTFDVAALLAQLVLAEARGTYHGVNGGRASWYEYVGDVLEAAGRSRDQVAPVSTADLDPPRPAARPPFSVLDDTAVRLGGFDRLPHYRESLPRLLADMA